MKDIVDRKEFVGGCKFIRLRKKMSIYDVSKETGLDSSTISRFENGKINNLDLYIYYKKLSNRLD